ncbi:MAG: PAS domain S-box protein [Candidatus Aegiribacteria sp.]|nr:PAS domain S-box protein [Candidatus Aegiribacteria sp.]
MKAEKKYTVYRSLVSISFGLLGFAANFVTIDFSFPPYTATVLIGLLFPLLITLAWGWKYGLLSALAGGCQTMWWLWGPANGYATLFVVPPFTIWIVWHGYFANLRRKQKKCKWWLSMYAVEFPFRILNTINLYTLSRWAITWNPPAWGLAPASSNVIPMSFSHFVVIKQFVVAYIILLLADVLLNLGIVRKFLKLRKSISYRKTAHIIGFALLIGAFFWIVDSFLGYYTFHSGSSFLDLFALRIPSYVLYMRAALILACLTGGVVASGFLRKQHENEVILRESEEKLRLISDSAEDSIIMMNNDGNVCHWNKASEEMFGYKAEDIIGKNLHATLMPPRFIEVFRKGFRKFADSGKGPAIGKTMEMVALKKDGTEFPVELSISSVRIKDKWGAVSIVRDITERRKATEALRESEKRFRQVSECAEEWIWEVDANALYTYASPVVEKLIGYKPEEIVGKKHSYDLFHTDDIEPLKKATLEIFSEKKPLFRFPNRNVHKNGNIVWLLTSGLPILDEEGNLLGYRGTDIDITEQKKLERQKEILQKKLFKTEKLETIGTLAGGIAHDFNNILTPIIGYTDMALSNLPSDNPVRTDLEEILNGANRAKDLVNQILTFSQQMEKEKEPLRLHLIVNEALKLMRPSIPATIEIKRNIDESCPVILADPIQMHEVVVNLCTNAYQAMEREGGVITIELKPAYVDKTIADSYPNLKQGKYIRLTVSDTGHGIIDDILGHIFEPFFTTKGYSKGSGMGLSIVHGIVQSHDGEIIVYSEPGKGTAFHIYLPVTEEAEKPVKVKDDSLHYGHEAILIVDDEEAVTRMLEKILRQLGYEVDAFNTPADALESFRKAENKYDIVLTDLTMPGMTGLDLAEEIRKLHSEIPIVLMTGYGLQNHEDIRRKNVSKIVGKPIDIRELTSTIRDILRS